MKSEFITAFNEICEARGLPSEVVFEALRTALASAYRRDINVSNTQAVTVDIDPHTGAPTIYAEKEVVDSIIDNRTEILLSRAKREGHTDIEMGDMVMAESTPANFGRIAAQTAKQVILQRVREAERDQLYDDFSDREGEIINGTVQSIGGQHITIGLGRTEAILPKSQQVSGERYRAHDKIRVYVLEVRRTNRGPQILVSRNHRNLLRRLLELEVPEIYNGQVDIKSIAREAGARSKVAVMALQIGVDPVGACVGMRGVRIQSIVRELNDEKIDVIEWDPDQHTFIAKALSPARVSQVYLEDHPDSGKTAVVIVPDDQLSLAIGREGQNARLAAKLTGWRIDIKSLTESATDSLNLLDHPLADKKVVRNKELLEKVERVLAKKRASRPITAEDYLNLDQFILGVEGRIISERAASFEKLRKERAAARKRVPAYAWDLELEALDLPARIYNLLDEQELKTVGDVFYRLEIGDSALLDIDGFGEKALETVKEAAGIVKAAHYVEVEVEEEPEVEVDAEAMLSEADLAELIADVELEEDEVADEGGAEAEALAEEEPEEEEEPIDVMDDLSVSLVQPVVEEEEEKKIVLVARQDSKSTAAQEEEAARARKGKQLVFDEKAGRVVTKRQRKRSGRPEWDNVDEFDF